MAWIEGIPVYVLHPRHVISFPSIHKICEMYGNPSMATCASHHIIHLHVDGLVFCRPSQPWAHILGGLWPGWRVSLYMDGSPGLSDHSYASTRHEKKGVDPSMTTDTSYYNRHLLMNGLIVCKSSKILACSFGGQ